MTSTQSDPPFPFQDKCLPRLQPELWILICSFLVNPPPRASAVFIPTSDGEGKKTYHQHDLVQVMQVSKVGGRESCWPAVLSDVVGW
jgi:hypothetical protein